jgi:enamine deaminase RidA (YjgF/YER057c/UK114 family)
VTSEIAFINPDGVSRPLGPYSHAVEVPGGASWLYVAGQVAVNERGEFVSEGDLWGQMQQVFANLDRVLAAARYRWEDVVKTTTYLTRAADIDAYRECRMALYEQYLPSGRYPASTSIVVERLAADAFLLETEAVAAR